MISFPFALQDRGADMKLKLAQSFFAIAFSIAVVSVDLAALPNMTLAQGSSTVSAVTLQVVPGEAGRECVVTPKGKVVPLPGPGVNGSAVQIYMGSQGGFWYVDRNGQSVDLTEAVARYRSMYGGGGMGQTAPVPQCAPQTVYVQQPQQSSGMGALGTATAAGLGAMAGSAISGSWNNVPYGTPVYYPHGGSPYYVNHSGNTVNVDNAHNYNAHATQYNASANNFEKQQQYYSQQQHQNTQQYQKWQQNKENPFTREDANFQNAQANNNAGGRRGDRQANAGSSDNGGGRRGRGDSGGSDNGGGRGGRFGRRGR
jgi:hypothetical protein